MILITGAAGFIGSCVSQGLYQAGYDQQILVDDFSVSAKQANWQSKSQFERIDRAKLLNWLRQTRPQLDWIVHLGARTDTAEQDVALFDRLNLHYTQALWQWCQEEGVPFLYASSAATYGDGSLGFQDTHAVVADLKPLNPYGWSKQQFDQWALKQVQSPPRWMGVKFFNVYGPNEYHKGRMASVIFHTFQQIKRTGGMKLFRSHRPDYAHGEQKRDFLFVMDLVKVIRFLIEHSVPDGLYNLGTGKARTFNDLAINTFHSLGLEPDIQYIDTPVDIRASYQYFTEADMSKLRGVGFQAKFTSLEEGIKTYVQQYLSLGKYY